MKKKPARDTVPGAGTKSLGGGDALRAIEQLRVHVAVGPDAGKTHEARGDRVVIGTHPSCDFALADEAVSRFHCDLAIADGRIAVTDLGSTNGTLIDGVQIERAYVRGGSVIRIGASELQVDVGARRVEVAISLREELGLMVGRSTAMRRVFATIEKAAASDATVLLTGETGTGKDIAAESLHVESARRDAPFVAVDCGAIPSELLESELFGHEKGAFTGAASRRDGAFLAARGGTLLLDEIGELPIELQPKLLRVLERREVKRVGGDAYVPVDVRVVAATNRDLRAEVNAKRFRSDLYYRLAVLEIRLPALRERLEDVPLLVDRLLARMSVTDDAAAPLRAPAFRAALLQHGWPGNVRELRNHVERALALREPLPPDLATGGQALPALNTHLPFHLARQQWLDHFERHYAEQLLSKHGGNIAAAARECGVDRVTLYRLLWRHRLR
jgi:DNA-binding NtrC family response regulator